jgi:hypothetical protein
MVVDWVLQWGFVNHPFINHTQHFVMLFDAWKASV